ncbi:MAG TPA: hypothetical protein VFN44_16085, partial [Solirubrobacteraceae bacterium]|nr:hypothetical protein [Solirubrobacteraceae bacterium]
MWRGILAILAAAAASPLLVRAAPGYDPWTWLLWGREVAGGTLSTVAGPAFKPLPVAVCALLAPLGSAAPVIWVVLVRAAAITALVLAYRLGRDLDHPRQGQTPLRVGGGLADPRRGQTPLRVGRGLADPRQGQTPLRVGRGLAVVGVALLGGFALEA